MSPDQIPPPGSIPACAVLSPPARIVLGCLEILEAPSVDGLVQITGLTCSEVRRCIAELHAVGAATTRDGDAC
jgi:hypothetical protein